MCTPSTTPARRSYTNLQKDPFELQSRHNASAYASVKARRADDLHQLHNCAGGTCLLHSAPQVYLWPWISTACWKVGRLTQGMFGWVIAPIALKPISSWAAWVWSP